MLILGTNQLFILIHELCLVQSDVNLTSFENLIEFYYADYDCFEVYYYAFFIFVSFHKIFHFLVPEALHQLQ